jgi:prepilin-type N-terminal cleavage/methylation domain-containing protein
MTLEKRHRGAYTLVELLLVLAIIGILASVVIPSATPSIHNQLTGAARLLAGDLAYARSLAVSHNSSYRIQFGPDPYEYVLSHSGSDSTLDALPPSAFRSASDPPDAHIVRLDEIPSLVAPVMIDKVVASSDSATKVDDIEFGPMGETTRPEESIVWLSAGMEGERRYMPIHVNPVTGLATVGTMVGSLPSSGAGGMEAEEASPPPEP